MKHEAIIELLPWYANESLDVADRRVVEEHLGSCDGCRAELVQWSRVGAHMRSVEGEPALPPGMLNETLARIDAWEREQAADAAQPGFLGRVRDALVAGWQPLPGLARTALATQMVLVMVLAGALVLGGGPSEPGHTTLAGPSAVSAAARLHVSFDAELTVSEMRVMLLDIDAEIVSGPSSQGLYTVELTLDKDQTEEVKVLAEELRHRPGVRFVGRMP